MNELVMINKHNGMGHHSCQFDDGKMEELIGVIRSDVGGKLEILTTEIRHVSGQQRDMVRWLLVVVCAIALGKGAIDIMEKAWSRAPTVAVQQ